MQTMRPCSVLISAPYCTIRLPIVSAGSQPANCAPYCAPPEWKAGVNGSNGVIQNMPANH
jgi:hypothetical protein